jgi:lysophospholipase L1-like esterase
VSDVAPCRLGLVALGDSITYGEGGIVLGVDGRSWALWLAMALELPYTNLAVAGVGVDHVVGAQVPRVRAHYDLACLYIGVNDVRRPDWVPAAYERDLRKALTGLGEHATRTLVCTVPRDLGRPPAGPKVLRLNAIVRAAAADRGALVCALDDLAGWKLVLPDAVHPTALGQLEIADRAARVLGAPRLPSALVEVDRTRRGALRFARGWAGDLRRDVVRRGVERLRTPR